MCFVRDDAWFSVHRKQRTCFCRAGVVIQRSKENKAVGEGLHESQTVNSSAGLRPILNRLVRNVDIDTHIPEHRHHSASVSKCLWFKNWPQWINWYSWIDCASYRSCVLSKWPATAAVEGEGDSLPNPKTPGENSGTRIGDRKSDPTVIGRDAAHDADLLTGRRLYSANSRDAPSPTNAEVVPTMQR